MTTQSELTISEIRKELGFPDSTIHRLLTTLKYRGYVDQDYLTGKYRLGIKLFELSDFFEEQKYLISTAVPYLRHLGNLTRETINLATLDQGQNAIIYLAVIESSEILQIKTNMGSRHPAHCTALGKVLLAFLPQAEFDRIFSDTEELPVYTPRAIPTVAMLRNHLEKIRSSGVAVDNEEFKQGVRCLAAPIRDHKGRVVAAVSIAGPTSRLSMERVLELQGPLGEACVKISEKLGFKTGKTIQETEKWS